MTALNEAARNTSESLHGFRNATEKLDRAVGGLNQCASRFHLEATAEGGDDDRHKA